ncbi:cupin domain-containing protein [Sediminibacterium soli]|uniref:cupin domain-containing protein n=1 Tax=Sediminibacterium soli TaxID=2698829 RepID=UPI001379AB7B|nr:cupin domain-containing protein [Sediminibacterium soli]NCI47654.1 cupin domain-containing protein [Sediminibacterium soli]
MITVSKDQPLKHYQWGNGCDGWNFVDSPALSVKQERMPAGTAEALHYHRHAQQFFFLLKGEASFEVEEKHILVKENEGLHIEPGTKHRIINHTQTDIEFILASQPSAAGDRYNI